MNNLIFQFFVLFCVSLFVAGCVFSWKPNIEGSNVNVSDKTDVSVPYEKTK